MGGGGDVLVPKPAPPPKGWLGGDCAAPKPPYVCDELNEALALLVGAGFPKAAGAPNPAVGCCWLLELLLDPKGGFGGPVPPPNPIIIYFANCTSLDIHCWNNLAML